MNGESFSTFFRTCRVRARGFRGSDSATPPDYDAALAFLGRARSTRLAGIGHGLFCRLFVRSERAACWRMAHLLGAPRARFRPRRLPPLVPVPVSRAPRPVAGTFSDPCFSTLERTRYRYNFRTARHSWLAHVARARDSCHGYATGTGSSPPTIMIGAFIFSAA